MDGQQGELTIERMCTLAAVSRAGYYRFCEPGADADEEESRLRDAIQREVLGSRDYGYRRVTRALRNQGWKVNHKRVARLMREDNLLAIRKRRFVPQTTDGEHDFEVAVNAARRLTPMAINQLWVADITYIRLGRVDERLATTGETCPLILDDVLVQSDRLRKRALLDVMLSISRTRQVILFTQEEEVLTWAQEHVLAPNAVVVLANTRLEQGAIASL